MGTVGVFGNMAEALIKSLWEDIGTDFLALVLGTVDEHYERNAMNEALRDLRTELIHPTLARTATFFRVRHAHSGNSAAQAQALGLGIGTAHYNHSSIFTAPYTHLPEVNSRGREWRSGGEQETRVGWSGELWGKPCDRGTRL
ncbi:hypothetical protein GJ744_007559 [Endocarpon pusillum]|uniref:Uncharacterized protein n=1 Tax=Endocarpon pusillum TaxID=364733 RepID=A0A8H7AIF5_9EURO|nr:hypothetical protein GJ744_007559 [Endocarpon pusillum]